MNQPICSAYYASLLELVWLELVLSVGYGGSEGWDTFCTPLSASNTHDWCEWHRRVSHPISKGQRCVRYGLTSFSQAREIPLLYEYVGATASLKNKIDHISAVLIFYREQKRAQAQTSDFQ